MGNSNDKPKRITSIGGQAVIEGVMMRGKHMYAMAVRKPNKEIELVKNDITSTSDKYKIFKLPIFRGILAFVESLVVGMKIIGISADIAGLDEPDENAEPSKFESFLEKTFGEKLNDYIIYFSVAVSLLITVFLFIMLPVTISSFANRFIGVHTWILGIVEGITRIAIFLIYILLISKTKEIKRTFMYHGAEHKTINCFEHEEELTVANVRKYTRLHKRCGTSFLLIVMMISIIVFMFVRTNVVWLRVVLKLVLAPLIAGISYEVIKWAGKRDNAFVNMVSYPGLCLQKITTSEPDDDQIETAIVAMKEVLASEPTQ